MANRSAFSHAMRDIKASIRLEMSISRALKYQPRFQPVAQLPVNLSDRYFVTTDKGIFSAVGDQLLQVTPFRTYGFSIHGEYAYCATTLKKWSFLLKCKLESLLEDGNEPHWQVIRRYEAPDTNCRFHGMDVNSESLWLANTGKGGLVKFDLTGNNPPQELSLFLDHFGEPIQYDLNHINGVSAYEKFTLFTSYKIGSTSGIGLIVGDNVSVFAAPNRGIHDAYFLGEDIYHCDTFGQAQQGNLMCNNKPVDEDYFSKPPGFIIRGVAGTKEEMLLGHSHKGARKDRFKGSGSILFLKEHKVHSKINFHGSQIYQIIRADGVALAPKPVDMSPARARIRLVEVFGPPVYENKVHFK